MLKKLLFLITATAIFLAACSAEGPAPVPSATPPAAESVAAAEIMTLVCGSQPDCLSELCAETGPCPLTMALSNPAVFDFVKTYSECKDCNTPQFSPDLGIGRCIEYQTSAEAQGWIVKFWVSDNCSFRYADPTQASIAVTLNAESAAIEQITPAVEYIQDASYCQVDSDCKSLSGSGVAFIGCSNFLYAPLNWSGYTSGSECGCNLKINQCQPRK